MIKRYECFTGNKATNYDATVTDDGPWVSYEDHSDVIQRLLQHSHSRERMNSRTIATLRAETVIMVDEAYNARQSAKGENALRLEAEDDHAKEIASLRAQLEEACNFVVDSECSCLPGGSPGNEGTCERCVWLEERDDD